MKHAGLKTMRDLGNVIAAATIALRSIYGRISVDPNWLTPEIPLQKAGGRASNFGAVIVFGELFWRSASLAFHLGMPYSRPTARG
jgi:hypothetical protein